jgi:hypothetical protein
VEHEQSTGHRDVVSRRKGMDNGDNEGGVSESDGGMLYTIPESSQHGRVASNWCRGQAAHIQLAGMEGFFSTTCLSCEISGISEFSY